MSGGDDGARAAADRTVHPSWPGEPCPPWCTRVHAADDHPEDRYHQSDPSLLAVVAGPGDTVPVTASLRPLTLVVRAGRYDGGRTWLVVEAAEDARPRLALTVDAARALAEALQVQLDAVADDP